MKKVITIFVIVFATTLLLTSCRKDDGGITTGRTYTETEYNALRDELTAVRAELNELTKNAGTNIIEPTQTSSEIGKIIQFGGHNWIILDVQEGKALIIVETIFEQQRRYNDGGGRETWETSSIRDYLNGDFYNSFSDSDRVRIAETLILNNDNPWYGTDGGRDTTDMVFLLSLEEVVKYFGDSGQFQNRLGSSAIISDAFNESRITTSTGGGALWWWLRSPGDGNNNAAVVRRDGIIDIEGYGISGDSGSVRPALWLNLH
jgi:hypothetical protein